MMISLIRVIKFALQDLARNLGLTFITVFILTLMLFSANALWSVKILTEEAVRLIRDQVNISFYLNAKISDKDLVDLKNYLQSFREVTDLKVLSKNDVLQSFQKRHAASLEVLAALSELGGNPFGPTLVVKTAEPKDYSKIIAALNVPEYQNLIEGKSFEGHEDAIGRIQNITNRAERIGFGLSLFFAFIAFLIIFNTIQIAISTQRIEIGIKRLVGANNWFIRGPYFIESVIFTILSVVITGALMWFALRWADSYVSTAFPNGFSLTNYYRSHILYLAGIQAAAVLFLTLLSSMLAMRRQLKV